MAKKTWLTRSLVVMALATLSLWALQLDALARVGGGRTTGSRGSKTFTAPKPYTPPTTQPRTTPPAPGGTFTQPRPTTPPVQQPGGFMRSFAGGMVGGLVGGLLFRSIFGGSDATAATTATGGYKGPGLFDILLLVGIGYLIYRIVKGSRRETAAEAPYQSSGEAMPGGYQPGYQPSAFDEGPQRDPDLERGLGYIRQMDPAFNEDAFRDQCMDYFMKIQAAWANREMSPAKYLLSDEMYRNLDADAAQLLAKGRINRLENIMVRSVDLTEAWQESGRDYITVRIYANLTDYVVDEKSGAVVEGSKTDPVKFEEYWTFARSVGSHAWQLTAINQPA